jgi:hypothetical protein
MSASGETMPEPDYLRASSGVMSWVFTVDHKRIGLMYLAVLTAGRPARS